MKGKERKILRSINFRAIFVLILTTILILSSASLAVSEPEERGPSLDVVRFRVVGPLDAQISGMMECRLDAVTDLIRLNDIETLDRAAMTITSAPGFHMGHIAFNIRTDQSYRWRGDHALVAKVLSDVWFRLALFKCFNKYAAVFSTYRYIVTPIHSLVPPSQGIWHNPGVPKVGYSPGDEFATTEWPEDDSACGVLRYAGYTYDPSINNWRTPETWEAELGGKPIPVLKCWWPSVIACPWVPRYLAVWVADCHAIGLTSIHHEAAEPYYIFEGAFGEADFDMFLMFWSLGRSPDHIYDVCHSSQDSALYPWRYNAPGINDSLLDSIIETMIYSLNTTEKMIACYRAQEMLYDENYPNCAFAYMQMYSRTYYNAYKKGLMGIVDSPGYGSQNKWTLLNMHWNGGYERIEDGKEVAIWALDEEPERLNPCFSSTVYTQQIINPTLDGLIALNPYTHEDETWIATSWNIDGPINETVTLDSENRYLGVPAGGIVEITDGMKVTFNLRDDVQWQCGNPYEPSDAEFSLEFLRNNQIPKYSSMWQHIVDVHVMNDTAFTIYSDATSYWLQYDFADTAVLLPPPVWSWLDGQPLDTIMGYNPATNTTKPPGAGDRFGEREPVTGQPRGAVTQLYGTGPFIFDTYDPAEMYTDMHANRHYFKTAAEVEDQLVEMFWAAGDVDRSGRVYSEDLSRYGLSYGYFDYEDEYDIDCDFNEDGLVDALDGTLIGTSFGDRREYLAP